MLTRARFAEMVRQGVGFPMRHRPWPGFPDARPEENLRFAYENGFLNGHADGSLRPQETMSRAHLFAAIAPGLRCPYPLAQRCRPTCSAILATKPPVLPNGRSPP
ncbi:MAG: S-layer homology domain-containing protein [Oscillatoriales cyanobacterium SM2_1_8]|nr:S-layer homology domain-containing protein [Oscillatoriales cyanobacterium SM2_1_8]